MLMLWNGIKNGLGTCLVITNNYHFLTQEKYILFPYVIPLKYNVLIA